MRRYTLFGLLALIMLLCGCTDGRSHSSDFDHPHSSDIDNNNGDRCPSCSSLNIGKWEFGMYGNEDSAFNAESRADMCILEDVLSTKMLLNIIVMTVVMIGESGGCGIT